LGDYSEMQTLTCLQYLLSKSDKKLLHEITVNSQCYLNRFSCIFGFSVTPQLHITFSWHLGIKISLGRR